MERTGRKWTRKVGQVEGGKGEGSRKRVNGQRKKGRGKRGGISGKNRRKRRKDEDGRKKTCLLPRSGFVSYNIFLGSLKSDIII